MGTPSFRFIPRQESRDEHDGRLCPWGPLGPLHAHPVHAAPPGTTTARPYFPSSAAVPNHLTTKRLRALLRIPIMSEWDENEAGPEAVRWWCAAAV